MNLEKQLEKCFNAGMLYSIGKHKDINENYPNFQEWYNKFRRDFPPLYEGIIKQAWELYCEDTRYSVCALDYWEQLCEEVQDIYLLKAIKQNIKYLTSEGVKSL